MKKKIEKFDYIGYKMFLEKGKYKIGLMATPNNMLTSLIIHKFYPPYTCYYKGEWSWDYATNNPNKNKDNINDIIFYNLDGEYGINAILECSKKVKLTYQEFLDKLEYEKENYDVSTHQWKEGAKGLGVPPTLQLYDFNGAYGGLGNDINLPEDQKYWLYYEFGDGENIGAWVFSDITMIHLDSSYNRELGEFTHKEFYHTSEVIEVLEKWKEALERWNNLEERAKMIEEYEREQGNK